MTPAAPTRAAGPVSDLLGRPLAGSATHPVEGEVEVVEADAVALLRGGRAVSLLAEGERLLILPEYAVLVGSGYARASKSLEGLVGFLFVRALNAALGGACDSQLCCTREREEEGAVGGVFELLRTAVVSVRAGGREVARFEASELERAVNNAAYERERRRLLEEHAGMYAVFALGRLIGVYATLEEVAGALRALRGRPNHAIVVKVGVDAPTTLQGGSQLSLQGVRASPSIPRPPPCR